MSLNSLSILIKIVIGYVSSKVIAIFVGPSGMALVGNLRNFLTTTEAFATLGFENGVVKYVAEHKEENEKLRTTLTTVFTTVLVSCILISLTLIIFSGYFNTLLFRGFHYRFIFMALALALPFYVGNTFLVATINGLGKFKKVVYINSIGSLLGLLVSIVLIFKLKTEGALLSIILTPSLLFFVSFFFVNKEVAVFEAVHSKFYSFKTLQSFSSYSLMALVAAVIGPMVYLAVRTHVIATIGVQEAGYWEAMSRLSSYYFLFVSSILGLYFLPKMAVSQNNTETKKLFWSYYRNIIPLFLAGLILLYFLRDIVIQLLFTKAFLPVSKLFFWQLIGDFFKACSFVLGYQFYAKKLTKAFVVTEACSHTILYFSSLYFISVFQLEGVVMAYAFTYLVYFLVLVGYFRKSLF